MDSCKFRPGIIIIGSFVLLALASLADAIAQDQSNNSLTTTDTRQQIIPFVTVRDITGSEKPSKIFGGERDVLRAGHCVLSQLSLESIKSVAEKTPFYLPEQIVKLAKVSLSPVEDFWSGLKSKSGEESPILYTHGYFVSFERGCKRASLLRKSLGLNGQLVLFSWPSDGAILNYTRDESDLFWSVDPLHNTILDMIDVFGEGEVDLVAHSLGTRGIMLALVRLAQARRADEPLINQVILIAPDIDAGIFEQYLPVIRPLAHRITVYVSSKDSALAVSGRLHGYPRLGQAGAHLEGLAGIDIIDMSDIPMRYPSGHVYHLYHNDAAADLSALLQENKSAAQRKNLKQTSKHIWSLQSSE